MLSARHKKLRLKAEIWCWSMINSPGGASIKNWNVDLFVPGGELVFLSLENNKKRTLNNCYIIGVLYHAMVRSYRQRLPHDSWDFREAMMFVWCFGTKPTFSTILAARRWRRMGNLMKFERFMAQTLSPDHLLQTLERWTSLTTVAVKSWTPLLSLDRSKVEY